MIGEDNSRVKGKPSLLSKYDVPIENLSYDFINQCEDVKTLEKIVKILRSGEEGQFPDLTQFSENKLKVLCPNNRLLVKPEPALPLSSLSANDRNKISHEMESWSNEMKKQESLLKGSDDRKLPHIPPIRSYGENINFQKPKNVSKKGSIKSLDYDGWNKYDADKEIMKMEIEEEREQEEHIRKSEKNQLDNKDDNLLDLDQYSDIEKEMFSVQEKDKGNEYFKAEKYEQATHFYTRSIRILPSVAAYNNRAISNLKLKKYGEVIMDCNEVLKLEPNNVKALFRRGNAYQFKGLLNEALTDFDKVLEVDPRNSVAKSHANELKKKLEETAEGKPKKARMVVEDMKSFEEELKSIKIFDKEIQPSISLKPAVPSWKSRYSHDPMSSGDNKLNEWGYPRVVCNCTSIPRAIQKLPPPKDPGKRIIHVGSKYKMPHQVADENSDCKLSSSCNNSDQVAPSSRDMPSLTSDMEAEGASGGTPPSDNRSPNVALSGADSLNRDEQPMEISKDDDGFKELDLESSNSPFNFLKIWSQLPDNGGFMKHSNLLKRISPSNLCKVIGDKLDGYMLSTIIACLHMHFTNDEGLLYDFLVSISRLPRFNAVNLFLSAQEKNVIDGLFRKLENSGKYQISEEMKAAYGL